MPSSRRASAPRELNPGLQHYRQILYHLSHQESLDFKLGFHGNIKSFQSCSYFYLQLAPKSLHRTLSYWLTTTYVEKFSYTKRRDTSRLMKYDCLASCFVSYLHVSKVLILLFPFSCVLRIYSDSYSIPFWRMTTHQLSSRSFNKPSLFNISSLLLKGLVFIFFEIKQQ